VFRGDIEKMYRQILIHLDDRQFQRIIHVRDQSALMKDFELNSHIRSQLCFVSSNPHATTVGLHRKLS